MRERQNRLSHFIAFLLFSFGLSFSAVAQNEIKGTVSDENGDPIIGASVTVLNGSDGTITDPMGQYSINLYDGNTKLIFSYFGFESQTLDAAGKAVLNVTWKRAKSN